MAGVILGILLLFHLLSHEQSKNIFNQESDPMAPHHMRQITIAGLWMVWTRIINSAKISVHIPEASTDSILQLLGRNWVC